MNYELRFFYALILTISVETTVIVVVLFFLFRTESNGIRRSRFLGAGVFPSLATLPYFWFVLPTMISSYVACILIGETVIFAVEIVLLRLLLNMRWRSVAILSFLANSASIVAGLLVF